jgi:hypothetical protein
MSSRVAKTGLPYPPSTEKTNFEMIAWKRPTLGTTKRIWKVFLLLSDIAISDSNCLKEE